MSPTHHSAVATVAGAEYQALEARVFSGYGGYTQLYARVTPTRAASNIPHHVAVESREDGERSGRIYYANKRPWARPAVNREERVLMARVVMLDCRHSALV